MDRLGVRLRTAAVLGCAAVATHGCGDVAEPAAPSANQRLDLAVVGVSARIGDDDVLASGIVVDGDRGLVLTTAHSVWGARSLRLATAFGVLHGRIVARAPCDDLALLQLHPRIPGLAALPTAPAGSGAGELLRSIGRRADAPSSALASIPVRMTPAARSGEAEIPLSKAGLPLDSPLVPEVSGGPIVDQAGRLVGMAESMAAEGTAGPAVSMPWARIRERLNELRPGPRRVFVGWAQQYRCVGRQHAHARSMHPGYRASDARLDVPIAPTRLPGTEGMDG